jgi:hypothetical protein
MEKLTCQCPFCDEVVEVEPEQAGENILCPRPVCRRPFRLEIPAAKILLEEEGAGEGNSERTLTKVHPAMFRKRPIRFLFYWCLIGAGVAGGGWWWTTNGDALGAYVGIGLASLGLALLGFWWLEVISATLTVTTKRTIQRTGIISRQTSEVRHNDVRNLQLDQSVFERLCGVGDISISSAGQANLEIVADAIPHPERIIATIRERQG